MDSTKMRIFAVSIVTREVNLSNACRNARNTVSVELVEISLAFFIVLIWAKISGTFQYLDGFFLFSFLCNVIIRATEHH